MSHKDKVKYNISCIAFTERGMLLARRIAASFGGTAFRSGEDIAMKDWTREGFQSQDALIFVGAAGIAVRAISPFVRDKAHDPAVIVIDEAGLNVIPILSGHLGGANDLAREIGEITGANPVITTATDINDVFAVDEWARKQGCIVKERERIVNISGALLSGEEAIVMSRWPVEGDIPSGIRFMELVSIAGNSSEEIGEKEIPFSRRVILDIMEDESDALHIVPRIVTLGIGCRKGTPVGKINLAVSEALAKSGVTPLAISGVATIDIKKKEQGLLEYCRNNDLELTTFSAEELNALPGEFTSSDFVTEVTGVDNVCERSAAKASGGSIILRKTGKEGVTVALALAPFTPEWPDKA